MDTVQKLFRFLDESPTCYHAAANAKAALTAAGAVELRESEQWKLEKGTLYVVERGDSALVAFRVPEGPFHGFLMAAARIVMVIVLATMVAGQLNVPITSLIALLSLFALAVSLSVQDVLANVVSGMVILIAKPFVAGNFISTQNAEGTVERIGLMYTHLVTADNKAVMIPNKEISTERIINYTAKDYRRVDVKLCIGSEIDTDAVLDALAAACKRAEEGREAIKPPFVGINAYQAGGIEYVARVYAPTEAYWDVYYRFMLLIRQELTARKIVVLSDSTYIKNGDV